MITFGVSLLPMHAPLNCQIEFLSFERKLPNRADFKAILISASLVKIVEKEGIFKRIVPERLTHTKK